MPEAARENTSTVGVPEDGGGLFVPDPEFPWTHPGQILKRTYLPNLDISLDKFIHKTGLSEADTLSIFEGELDIDEDVHKKLKNVLGPSVARLLLKMQRRYNQELEKAAKFNADES